MAEWFKAPDLRSGIYDAWVRTPLLAKELFISLKINTKASVTLSGLRRRSAVRIYDAEIRSSIYGAWVRIPSLANFFL